MFKKLKNIFKSKPAMVGIKGKNFMDAGYVYAPYIPIMRVPPQWPIPEDNENWLEECLWDIHQKIDSVVKHKCDIETLNNNIISSLGIPKNFLQASSGSITLPSGVNAYQAIK